MFDGRPAYWFGAVPEQVIVYADDGKLQEDYAPELNLRTASAWAGLPPSQATVEQVREPDQWTVGDASEYLPLVKYSFPDGQQVYVSPSSGQVMQATTRASRLGAYLGPIPHWLYFTPLRKNGLLWTRIVIWLAGIGTLMAISGLLVGVLVYSPSKRYRFEGEPASIPYAGTKRLHMIFGLFFGILACTWAFSGMLSMDPFPALLPQASPGEGKIVEALRGDRDDLALFSKKLPAAALQSVPRNLKTKAMDLMFFAGDPFYIAYGAITYGAVDREAAKASYVIPVDGAPRAAFDPDQIVGAIRKTIAPGSLAEVRTVTRYEAYYADRTGERPLPAIFVRPRADEPSDGYYIDPATADIVDIQNADGGLERWLYHGLHSFDFPWLYNYRPAWDIVVLLLLAGGATLCVTSAILAWKLLQRKIG